MNLTVVITVLFLIALIVEIKFQPRLDKINDDNQVKYIVWYSIKSKFGDLVAREFFILFTINKN